MWNEHQLSHKCECNVIKSWLSKKISACKCSMSIGQRRSSLALREILREEKHRHECRSDNKREVTAWESSPNQNAQMHKNNKKNPHNMAQIPHIQNTAT